MDSGEPRISFIARAGFAYYRKGADEVVKINVGRSESGRLRY
jgi:hypothetical protein